YRTPWAQRCREDHAAPNSTRLPSSTDWHGSRFWTRRAHADSRDSPANRLHAGNRFLHRPNDCHSFCSHDGRTFGPAQRGRDRARTRNIALCRPWRSEISHTGHVFTRNETAGETRRRDRAWAAYADPRRAYEWS